MRRAFIPAAMALALAGQVTSHPHAVGGEAEGAGDALPWRHLDTMAARNSVVGYAVGIVENGALTGTHAFGERALGGARLTTTSVFHWASVSKPFVATAVMQLAERDLLDLDAKLVRVLPDYRITDDRQAGITIRHLLLHTSGLPDVEDYQWDRPQLDDRALARWVLEESPRELLFDPGSARKYSNVGYEVLGLVIARTSGLSFEQYMARNIFAPLAMTRTTFVYSEVPEALRTTGHAGVDRRARITHYPYNRRHGPSSTLNTNVEDMARFVKALLNGGELDGKRILRHETVERMWTPQWTIGEEPYKAAAMGWVVEDFGGHRIVRHFGWDDGFRSALIIFPADEAAVFLVSNDETAPIGELVKAAIGEGLVIGGSGAGR
jgi:CubicO group peptidase (beta-lactamase class C family)